MEHLTAQTFREKIFNFEKEKDWKYEGDKPCIIDFYADWCGPCQMMGPIIDQLSNELTTVTIGKLNVDDNPDTASKYGILSIPTMKVFKDGAVVKEFVGVQSKDALKVDLSAL